MLHIKECWILFVNLWRWVNSRVQELICDCSKLFSSSLFDILTILGYAKKERFLTWITIHDCILMSCHIWIYQVFEALLVSVDEELIDFCVFSEHISKGHDAVND